MSTPANPRRIGLFVLIALALLVTIVLIFGGGRYLSTTSKYVAYFQGSVHGLVVGAPVKLKGVTIGRVVDIRVQYDVDHNRVLTPVIAQADLSKITEIGRGREDRQPTLDELIARGLRARLTQSSLVTGQLYVDLNFLPDRPPVLVGLPWKGLPEIPTVPSGRDQIESTLEKAMADFRELPIRETVETTLRSLQRVEGLLAAPETQASIGNLNRTLEDLQRLIRHVDAKVDGLAQGFAGTTRESERLVRNLNERIVPLLDSTDRTLTAITATFNRAQGTLAMVEGLTEPDSALNTALDDLSAAARSIRLLAETLERNPETLLYGKRQRP